MERVHRTYWRVRQRYRRAGYLGALVGMVLCAVWLVPRVHGSEQSAAASAAADPLGTLALLLIAALLPHLLARFCWRLHRRRYYDDIYLLGVV